MLAFAFRLLAAGSHAGRTITRKNRSSCQNQCQLRIRPRAAGTFVTQIYSGAAMSYSQQRRHSFIALCVGALACYTLPAQQPAPAKSAAAAPMAAPAAAPSSTLSSSLGLYVFPSKNQTASQQSTDEGACFGWAKSQTGIDPMNVSAEPTQASAGSQTSQAQSSSAGSGAGAKGAVGGAAAGAAFGAIAGNAGKGAAIGATTGVLAGGAAKRRAQQDAAAQQQQQAQTAVAQQKATYNKAFSACMEGKGYTVK